ncbi:Fe2+/Zn2+ uptake regulation protein [Halobacteroides halobius DSM 5150]|uniref:Fe2+/Zn2+ uptake regulation protein n=1 Tax=Halobacteroides halobius (strain ATCC 35273 / DSM 5150 / MD-1) TaxID=748449 RepID=L0K8C9_HALHC|nr:transcriptional repressor [Halobacteroides halobius]AGB40368.1 Fe2+/Zn2+ uptake regulation protein [Halobacteroides halobius DSM 5150]
MGKLTKKQRRMTKQRKKILKVLQGTTCHPTADWVYEQVKKEIPNVSLGTIYRNLNVLQEMGKIQELNYGSDYSRFDGNPKNHYHFTCLKCDEVIDVELEVVQEMNQQVADLVEGEVKYHRTEFFGYCSKCKE